MKRTCLPIDGMHRSTTPALHASCVLVRISHALLAHRKLLHAALLVSAYDLDTLCLFFLNVQGELRCK
jgi:hypothetical protein